VRELLDNLEFDTIYHEHLSYLSINAMEALLFKSPLMLDQVREYPIHGGAILLTLIRRGRPNLRHESVDRYLRDENFFKERWDAFKRDCCNHIMDLTTKIGELVVAGKSVCGYGASAKSTVAINLCNFSRRHIRFICDETPQKQWKFSPGSDIPIVDEGALIREQPDYCLLFAWNWASEIIAKNNAYLCAGGKFIVPGKTLEIVGA